MNLVVWADKQGAWHCMEDKCPHRWVVRAMMAVIAWGQAHSQVLRGRFAQAWWWSGKAADRQGSDGCQTMDVFEPLNPSPDFDSHSATPRLAPLSEGRIEDGGLMCSYHGQSAHLTGAPFDLSCCLVSRDSWAARASTTSHGAACWARPLHTAYSRTAWCGAMLIWPSSQWWR